MMKTKFYNCHLKHNAKMVEFAGYQMPIQYSSIIAEHKAVRNSVGVFDVSHMGEIFVRGEKALDFVQHITINDAAKLFPGRVQYSAMCYEDGGIVDDLLVYMISKNEYLLVINASNIEKDFNWMKKQNIFNVELVNESEKYSLLAIQGPNSKNVIQKIFDFTIDLEYYHFIQCKILGMDMFLSRTGYTGELGYEIYFKGSESEAELLWEKIFESGKAYDIQPVGLGARDSLRLEMGFCLYGNDIDQHTNPLEAGLGWITKLNKANFIAKDVLVKIKSDGLNRKLTPLITDEKAFPRHGYDVTYNSNKVGYITSGTVSPILEKGIALAYIDFNYVSDSAEFCFLIRGKEISARVTKLPFVKK